MVKIVESTKSRSSTESRRRRVDYYQPSRLRKELSSFKVSIDVASDMFKKPEELWLLLILEVCEEPFDLDFLKSREQFWMLLIPTSKIYKNISLRCLYINFE